MCHVHQGDLILTLLDYACIVTIHLGISCTVFVLTCTAVVLTCFVMYECVYVWVFW